MQYPGETHMTASRSHDESGREGEKRNSTARIYDTLCYAEEGMNEMRLTTSNPLQVTGLRIAFRLLTMDTKLSVLQASSRLNQVPFGIAHRKRRRKVLPLANTSQAINETSTQHHSVDLQRAIPYLLETHKLCNENTQYI